MASVIHDTFTIDKTYPATTARVFAAFASVEAKDAWGDTGEIEPLEGDAGASEFDFRIGGREIFGHRYNGIVYRYEGCYYDIVPDQRIVYTYEMYANGDRISVSVTTIQFIPTADGGTALSFTEQGAYLDGHDGDEAPALRREGTQEMLDNLTNYLAKEV